MRWSWREIAAPMRPLKLNAAGSPECVCGHGRNQHLFSPKGASHCGVPSCSCYNPEYKREGA